MLSVAFVGGSVYKLSYEKCLYIFSLLFSLGNSLTFCEIKLFTVDIHLETIGTSDGRILDSFSLKLTVSFSPEATFLGGSNHHTLLPRLYHSIIITPHVCMLGDVDILNTCSTQIIV